MAGCSAGCRCPEWFRKFKTVFKIGFGGVSDKEFAVPQANWCWQPISWIVYRYVMAIYAILWLGLVLGYWGVKPHYSAVDTKAKWLIYVSDWSYIALCLYFLVAAISTTLYHIRTQCEVSSESLAESDTGEEIKMSSHGEQSGNGAQDIENGKPTSEPATLSWYFKLTWLLQDICYTAALFVTILFYVLEFDPETTTLNVFKVHIHGVNLALALIDQFLVASPFRLLHFIYPSLYALTYFIFTLIYHAAGGKNTSGGTHIYSGALDWTKKPSTSAMVMCLVVLVAAPVLHFLFWLVYHLRRYMSRRGWCRCCRNSNDSP